MILPDLPVFSKNTGPYRGISGPRHVFFHTVFSMPEINEYLSNGTESRGEKRVINYPNLSESVRLNRERKMETKTSSPKKRRLPIGVPFIHCIY